MASPWIDISVALRTDMTTWPGDPAVRVSRVLDLDRGDECTVSLLEMGAHTGTHMDAPLHFIRNGMGIDDMPLDTAIGTAQLISIQDRESITVEELAQHSIRSGERILFRTHNSDRCWETGEFVEDFVYLSAKAARYLAERRVRLVGIDYLSVGGFQADGAEAHLALLEAGVWIVEGLNLKAVEPGRVQLMCLPLKIAKGDGAPARALVRPLDR